MVMKPLHAFTPAFSGQKQWGHVCMRHVIRSVTALPAYPAFQLYKLKPSELRTHQFYQNSVEVW